MGLMSPLCTSIILILFAPTSILIWMKLSKKIQSLRLKLQSFNCLFDIFISDLGKENLVVSVVYYKTIHLLLQNQTVSRNEKRLARLYSFPSRR